MPPNASANRDKSGIYVLTEKVTTSTLSSFGHTAEVDVDVCRRRESSRTVGTHVVERKRLWGVPPKILLTLCRYRISRSGVSEICSPYGRACGRWDGETWKRHNKRNYEVTRQKSEWCVILIAMFCSLLYSMSSEHMQRTQVPCGGRNRIRVKHIVDTYTQLVHHVRI